MIRFEWNDISARTNDDDGGDQNSRTHFNGYVHFMLFTDGFFKSSPMRSRSYLLC